LTSMEARVLELMFSTRTIWDYLGEKAGGPDGPSCPRD
jgi:hypothetical protein